MIKKIFAGVTVVNAFIYAAVLYYMLFQGFGRTNIVMSGHMRYNYSMNLIPFKTIIEYIAASVDGSMRGHAILKKRGLVKDKDE